MTEAYKAVEAALTAWVEAGLEKDALNPQAVEITDYFHGMVDTVIHLEGVRHALEDGRTDALCGCGTCNEANKAGLRLYMQLREHQCQFWVAAIIRSMVDWYAIEETLRGGVTLDDLTQDKISEQTKLAGHAFAAMSQHEIEKVAFAFETGVRQKTGIKANVELARQLAKAIPDFYK